MAGERYPKSRFKLNRCVWQFAGGWLEAYSTIRGVAWLEECLVILLDTLHAQKEAINAACRQFGARRIRVFGSVARREERPDSDIDFLVDFPQGYDLFAQRLPLAERLTEITGHRLDVIPEHELNRHIRARVLLEAVDL